MAGESNVTSAPVTHPYPPTGDEETDRRQVEADEAVALGEFAGFPIGRASDSAQDGYCILLYSRGGGGKTTLAAGADDSPDDSPVVFVDAEGGTKAISHRKSVQVITVNSWDDIKKFRDECKRNPNIPWKTIVLDNLSEFIQLAVNKIVGSATDQVSQPKYGEMAREVLALVRDFRDLARKRKINVILIAWDSVERDETNKLMAHMNATPKLQKDLPGIVDIIGYISPIDGDPEHRLLTFEQSTRTIAKFRRNTTDMAKTIPLMMKYGVDDLPMSHILAALKGRKEFPKDKFRAPARASN